MLVVDASIALTWCFEDEATDATRFIERRVDSEGAIVPALWRLEIANVLLVAERRGRLRKSQAEEYLKLMADLPLSVDTDPGNQSWADTMLLARAHRLTAYDAAYLELAIRLDADLASLDRELRRAAKTMGVSVLP